MSDEVIDAQENVDDFEDDFDSMDTDGGGEEEDEAVYVSETNKPTSRPPPPPAPHGPATAPAPVFEPHHRPTTSRGASDLGETFVDAAPSPTGGSASSSSGQHYALPLGQWMTVARSWLGCRLWRFGVDGDFHDGDPDYPVRLFRLLS
jgi:hypothetical protein